MWNDKKGSRKHKETWWWNEQVAEAVREKKIKYRKWKKENTKEARMEYKKYMKVVERIFKHRIRQQIETDDTQFGFMKGLYLS